MNSQTQNDFRSGKSLLRICLVILASTIAVFSGSAFAQPLSIVGGSTDGDIRITVQPNGSILLEQLQASVWIEHLDPATDANGSILKSDLGLCLLGFNPTSITPNSTLVSHSLSPELDQITTIIDCPSAGLTWQQDVFHSPGAKDFGIIWTISKMIGFSPTVATFSHVQQTTLDGLSSATGIGSSALNLIGARDLGTGVVRGLTLESLEIPIASYSSLPSGLLSTLPTGGSLSNVIDAAYAPKALAFQWINTNFASETVWNLGVSEQIFTAPKVDDIFIVPPPPLNIDVSLPIVLPFLVVNDLNASKLVDLTELSTDSLWPTNILTPSSPAFIAAQSLIEVFVEVTAPITALDGDTSDIALIATSNSLNTNNFTTLTVKGVPLMPTALPTVAPTVVPTIVPTEVPTVVPPTPTSVPAAISPSFTFPYNSTGTPNPLLTGKAFPGALVTIIVDGIATGTAVADGAGNWKFSLGTALAVGPHVLSLSATDPLGRTNELSAPFSLLVTNGAELDFEGDGLSDLTSYTKLGASVIFRNKPSSGDSSKVVSVRGAVPAAADYDGDSITDFAAIRRSAGTFIWSIIQSSTNLTSELSFGLRGDTLLTGCRFASRSKYSLAVLRANDLLFSELGGAALQQISGIINKSQTVLGCSDVTGDGIDELIVAFGGEQQSIGAIGIDKSLKSLAAVPKFLRGYVARQPKSNIAFLATLKSEGSSQKSLLGLGLDDLSLSPKLTMPRKLILGSGTFLFGSNDPRLTVLYQDLKTNKVIRFADELIDQRAAIGTLARGARLVIPQYLYKTN